MAFLLRKGLEHGLKLAHGAMDNMHRHGAQPSQPVAPPAQHGPGAPFTTFECGGSFMRGIGGTEGLADHAAQGCNAVRTWGVDQLSQGLLRECAAKGVQVVAGLWIESAPPPHEWQPAIARLVADVNAWKQHKCIAMWLVGNEVENRSPLEAALQYIQAAAEAVKKADPGRLCATAVAEIGGGKAAAVKRLCPAIDVVAVNSYAAAPTLLQRLRAQGYTGAWMLGECGLRGHWESPCAPWGAPLEQPSTDKARTLLATYAGSVIPGSHLEAVGPSAWEREPVCVGAFPFYAGCKYEATRTWYGLYTDAKREPVADRLWVAWQLAAGRLLDGAALPAALAEARVPACDGIAVCTASGAGTQPSTSAATPHADVAAGASFSARVLGVAAAEAVTVEWQLVADASAAGKGSVWAVTSKASRPAAAGTATNPAAVTASAATTLLAPPQRGTYRLYAFVRYEGRTGVGTANIPIRVN